ncbi:hypothetical protein HKX48_005362 [Thoreauomyces humboldtii]|nr:hypothetical protein HKX48_005362 [Thoreauomyces humboldtii]
MLATVTASANSFPLEDLNLASGTEDVTGDSLLDLGGLLRQMDSADGALDQLENRTDALMKRIDALLEEPEVAEIANGKLEKETRQLKMQEEDRETPLPSPHHTPHEMEDSSHTGEQLPTDDTVKTDTTAKG